jgi:hypothetical protein
LALVIQVVDTSTAYKGIRKQLMIESKVTWGTPLTDPFWEHAASRYTKVRWIQPGNHSPQWQALAAYGGVHDLSTDAVYLVRISTSALKSAQRKATEVIQTGRYEPDSLYLCFG